MNNLGGLLRQHTFSAEIRHDGDFDGIMQFGNTGQLHILKSGILQISRPGRTDILVDQPSLLYFPRAIPHFLKKPEGSPVELVSVSIGFYIGGTSLIVDSLADMFYLQLNEKCNLSSTARSLIAELQCQGSGFGQEDILSSLGAAFILQILRYTADQGSLIKGMVSAINHPQLSKVIESIHASPQKNWNLDELANMAAMSRSKFAQQFKNHVGQTPNDYITNVKVAVAQKLLFKNRPIHHVAAEVGYEHGSALARVFKKRLGLSPRQWLQQNRHAISSVF